MPRGGYRPGAGRPRKTFEADAPPAKGINEKSSPLDYMLAIMRDSDQPDDRRDRMARAAAPYCHPKQPDGPGGPGGKKANTPDTTSARGELMASRQKN